MRENRQIIFFMIIFILIIVSMVLTACDKSIPAYKNDVSVSDEVYTGEKNKSIDDFFIQPFEKVKPVWKPVEVKGIYLTGWSAGNRKRFFELVDLVKSTGLNSMVIDIKDATGQVTFDTQVQQAKDINAVSAKINDIKEILRILEENHIYSIARIVVFKDPILAKNKPEWAVKTKDGRVWTDYKGKGWVNPYLKEVWEYNVKLAEEAAKLGFKEIQFDYVRFPSDGNLKNIVYDKITDEPKSKVIKRFLEYARSRLNPRGVYVSADVFGLVTSALDDLNIGQVLEDVAEVVDYICPMVYPSHYAMGSYGIPNPNASPYETVYVSLSHAVRRLNKMDNNKAIIRPWLQDFSLGYPYGVKEVKAQIKAVYDTGLKEWILWNPSNYYTVGALEKKQTTTEKLEAMNTLGIEEERSE